MYLRPVRAVSVEEIRVCVSKEGQRSVHPKSTWSPRCHRKVWTAYVNQRLEKPGFRGRSFGQLKQSSTASRIMFSLLSRRVIKLFWYNDQALWDGIQSLGPASNDQQRFDRDINVYSRSPFSDAGKTVTRSSNFVTTMAHSLLVLYLTVCFSLLEQKYAACNKNFRSPTTRLEYEPYSITL